MDVEAVRKNFLDSLNISRKFQNFWVGYKFALVVFFLIKGFCVVYDRQAALLADREELFSVCIVGLNFILAFFVKMLISLFMCLFSLPCGAQIRDQALGLAYIISLVDCPQPGGRLPGHNRPVCVQPVATQVLLARD